MLSEAARLTSATGTYRPSIWQKESPNWSLAISLRPGNSPQPDSLRICGARTVAPQRGQLKIAEEISAPHQGQVLGATVDVMTGSTGRGGVWAGCEYCTGAA